MRKSPESSKSNGSRVINVDKESAQSMDLNQLFLGFSVEGVSGDTRASRLRESHENQGVNEADYYSPNFAAISLNAAR